MKYSYAGIDGRPTRLDRLPAWPATLFTTPATISDCKAGFRSLGDAWIDTTRTAQGRLMAIVCGPDGGD